MPDSPAEDVALFIERTKDRRTRTAMLAAVREAVGAALADDPQASETLVDLVAHGVTKGRTTPLGMADISVSRDVFAALVSDAKLGLGLPVLTPGGEVAAGARSSWIRFLLSLDVNQSAIASAINVSTGSVSRWMSGESSPKAEMVIAIARAFDRSPTYALVAAGYLTDTEAGSSGELPSYMQAARLSSEEMLTELLRRSKAVAGPSGDVA